MQSWIFSIIIPVFSVTWSFRNHYNMLICCSRKNSHYYKCWKLFFRILSLIENAHRFKILIAFARKIFLRPQMLKSSVYIIALINYNMLHTGLFWPEREITLSLVDCCRLRPLLLRQWEILTIIAALVWCFCMWWVGVGLFDSVVVKAEPWLHNLKVIISLNLCFLSAVYGNIIFPRLISHLICGFCFLSGCCVSTETFINLKITFEFCFVTLSL